jgi:hypothetical protein
MEIKEVKDSLSTWFYGKMKSPYYGAVIAIWLVTNRVAVYCIFDFSDKQPVQERVNYIHQLLETKTVWKFSGFYGIVAYAFLMGIITMVVFNYINAITKWAYNRSGVWANSLRQKTEPHKWVLRKEVEYIKNKLDESEIEISAKKGELKLLEKQSEEATKSIQENRLENQSQQIDIAKQKSKISSIESELGVKDAELKQYKPEVFDNQSARICSVVRV